MKDTVRQIAVVLSVIATIVVNGLANALPLNGLNTGQISDRFEVYFVPAGYVFSIWGLIYIGLVAYAIYQGLPSQSQNPRLRATGWWMVLGGVFNSVWIFLWHFEQFPLTILVMLGLLATLIVTYLRLGIGKTKTGTAETWAVRVPVSVYLGWITVATVANATSLLDYLNWNGFGLAPEVWMGVVLAAVLVISVLMSFTRRDLAYTLVLLWALAGISFKHAAVAAVAIPTWITFGLIIAAFVAASLRRRPALQ
jgi:hypothetical protein